MNWADIALRLLVRRRDRDTISGDLLEEYREDVLPTKGAMGARLWYMRQVASFVSPVTWGLLLGIAFGTFQLLSTAVEPLADDTPRAMLGLLGTLLMFWIAIGVAAGRPTRRFRDAIVAGVLAGVVTMAVILVTSIVRVNVFLDEIQHRDDWVNLVARFEASGLQSLRSYANWEYVRGIPFGLALGALVGGLCGTVAGVINGISRPHHLLRTRH